LDSDAEITVHSLSKVRPESDALANGPHEKSVRGKPFAQAADGTRTHDLLHGKQYVEAPAASQ
jgi:hypothetical protein